MDAAGVLDYNPVLQMNLNQDTTTSTFAGMYKGVKVFIDPYQANGSNDQFYVMGFKGSALGQQGLFFCPYIPLEKWSTLDPNGMHPVIAYRTRYGLVANPFVDLADGSGNTGDLVTDKNYFYHKCIVKNIL
jgi:hypothetical protein